MPGEEAVVQALAAREGDGHVRSSAPQQADAFALQAPCDDALRDELGLVEAILDTAATLVVVLDSEQRLTRFNAACNRSTGRDFASFLGTTGWQALFPDADWRRFRRVLERLASEPGPIEHESQWRSRGDALHLICWRNAVLRDRSGAVKRFICTGVDITEQRNAEYKARETLEEASRLQRLQTANELATMLAHELNQPLAAIASYAEVGQHLLGKTPLDIERLTLNLQKISQQSLRAGESIRHLRAFVGQGRIEPVPLDLNAVVRSTCMLHAPKARGRGVSIVLDLDERLPTVMGVDVHIEQVLLNLLRNAVDAIRDAGMKSGHITVVTRNLGDTAQISVRDSGPGVDAGKLEKLFEPLSTTKKYGLGVGLRISRSLIEAHHGRLWAEPHTPGGIFHFTLPFAR